MKLAGDPDRDFAAMLMAHYEEVIFLAKTQLEYGGDRQLRQSAQRILDETQKEIDALKQWQVRMREPGYQAQPDQPPPGSGPLDRRAPKEIAQAPATAPAPQAAPPALATAQNLPMVSGTVEKVDAAAGKITIDHGPIPNLNMDSMTMVFRVQDPAMLKTVKPREKVRFTADRVNGQITVTKIEKGR
jgi:Cu/Ag efflux protein CusF